MSLVTDLAVFYVNPLANKRKVGTLFLLQNKIYFEYCQEFLQEPLPLSPLKLPIVPGLLQPKELNVFHGLFGVFADSLPDGWGLLLMKRALEQNGLSFLESSPLDRLAWIGARGMGALIYEPTLFTSNVKHKVFHSTLDLLHSESEKILSGSTQKVLEELYIGGGSPGGARPKVLVGMKPINSNELKIQISNTNDHYDDGYEPWMIKFPSKADSPEDVVTEYWYNQAAKYIGLDVPETKLLKLKKDTFAFAVSRFDRIKQSKGRIHLHSLAGLLHSDFRIPSLEYADFLRITLHLTKSKLEMRKAFLLMIFNILFKNCDDHGKNFSFLMNHLGEWKLAPVYDLTYSPGIRGEHMMTVLGKGKNILSSDLINLGKIVGIPASEVRSMIEKTNEGILYLKKEYV